jgi:sulfide:quinone oxidoreductase
MSRGRPHVLIAGGGVAGLETLLALRALAADRVDITILAPELTFVNRSMSAQQPFKVQRRRGFRLEDTAAELGAHWHRGALDRVEHAQHRVVTRDRVSLSYDMLVLALGARPQREWHAEGVLTYRGGRDGPNFRMLLHQLREGRIEKVAFVKPAGASWPLPLYDLALMTAADGAAHDRPEVELSLITPEEEPLAIFGSRASAAISSILRDSGVTLHTCSYGQPGPPGRLDISPGHRSLVVDRIVTEPRLVGPSLRGIPSGTRDSSTPTRTGVSRASMTCSRRATPRPSRSSRAVSPPSRPMPSPRRSPPPRVPRSTHGRSGPCCAARS